MRLKLDRPLSFIDIEGTGLDIAKDRIVSLTALRLEPDGSSDVFEWMFNPGFPMAQEVIDIHGITDDMVADKPPFEDLAGEVNLALMDSDLCGYNILGYDLPMLWEELNRVGITLDLESVRVIDACEIFKLKEPRDLAAALKKFCGKEHTGAHNATNDVLATKDVLLGQLEHYADLPCDVAELAKFSAGDRNRVDLCGTIVRNKDGVPVFNTKRNRNVPVVHDIGYAEWILRSDFPQSTKAAIRKVLNEPLSSGGMAMLKGCVV